MITIKLDYDEAVILHQILKGYIEDIRSEVHHTDNREYREALKSQEELVKRLLQELDAESVKALA